MRTTKRQVKGKLYGDRDLLEKVLQVLEQRTLGIVSTIKDSEQGDYHAFVTILEVVE